MKILNNKILLRLKKLLERSDKLLLIKLSFMMFLGMILEVVGIGILLPILNFLVDPESINKNVIDLFNIIGISSTNNIVITSLIFVIIFYIFKTSYMIYLNAIP